MDILLNNLEETKSDQIIQTAIDYENDSDDKKVNLCIGVCCTDEGSIHYFESVKEAERIVVDKYKEKPYIISNSTKDFCRLTRELIFGPDSTYIKEKKICTIQTVGGAGSLCTALTFLKNRNIDKVYVTDVPYINHVNMSLKLGLKVMHLKYFNLSTLGIDYADFLEGLKQVEPNSAVIIQPSCYNPCATDLDEEHFEEIAQITKEKNLLVMFDIAYQGFKNGDIDCDTKLIRLFQEKNILFIVCQSFSKSFSIYGERAGVVHVVCRNKKERQKLAAHFILNARSLYNCPPLHANRIVVEVLGNEKLRNKWLKDLKDLAEHVKSKRFLFLDKLEVHQKKYGLNFDWTPYKKQSGLYTFIPMLSHIYDGLRKDHVYIVSNGRVNVSGLSLKNIDFVVDRICYHLKEKNVKAY